MALVDVARAQDQRLACNSFAELAATVIQIRQREPEAIRVLDYADANLKDQYPPYVFSLVKEMIRDAFARQPVGTTSLEGEVRTFARQQRSECTDFRLLRGVKTCNPIRVICKGVVISIGSNITARGFA